MKNCFYENEKKYATSDKSAEKMKNASGDGVLLSSIGEGETFKIGEREFIVCEHLEDEKTAVLLKDLLFEFHKFGKNNNYNGSDVDQICNKFADEMEGLIGGALCEFSLDLTADDGLKCYGSIERKAALFTANMCRKYVEILDKYKVNEWWWTSTAYSTPKHDDSDWIKCVSRRGCISNGYYCYFHGVRPFCILKSDIFVSK